jgi:putative transport protein
VDGWLSIKSNNFIYSSWAFSNACNWMVMCLAGRGSITSVSVQEPKWRVNGATHLYGVAKKGFQIMSDVAISVSLLALVAVVGLWLGSFEFKGVGLGIGGVLFGGIFVGHFVHQQGIALDLHTLHFVQEFGLILFVYSIGIQVGPGFFSSLRSSGLRLNGFAALLVLLGGLVAAGLNRFMDVPLPVVLGIFSGAVTNTPSLGAGQQILTELGASVQSVSGMGMAYAMAYPFGICGILLSMWLLRLLFRINVNQEAQAFETQAGRSRASLATMNVALRNTNLNGLALSDVPLLADGKVICSRLKRGETLSVPRPQTSLEIGDILHLVGDMEALRQVQLVIGEAVETSLSTHGTELRVERVVVTNVKVIGKNLVELALTQTYDVVISRLNRAGVELVPEPSTTLAVWRYPEPGRSTRLHRGGRRHDGQCTAKIATGAYAAGVYWHRLGCAAGLNPVLSAGYSRRAQARTGRWSAGGGAGGLAYR